MCILDLANSQLLGQAIRHELNLFSHEGCVHADKTTGKCVADELLLQNHCLANEIPQNLRIRLLLLFMLESHRKERVKSLIARDQLIAERETWEKTPLLEPEDGTERTTKEDTLHSRKRRKTRRKALVRVDPLQSPVGFLGNTRNGLNRVK